MAVIGALVLALVWGGWSWWRDSAAEDEFLALAADGMEALGVVERQPASTGGHLVPGQSAGYRDRMPTAGAHDPKWIDPGVYDTAQVSTRLVHSLEHGMIVIYYDTPPEDVFATLESWAGLYGGPWSGLVVVPMPGLGEEIVLTAWERTLELRPFDAARAAAFIDRYRGRGPENPVR
ncbi:MAG: DUF3105 domain-containing protein [Rhodospirillales bacterium]|nr:MAG: DUF3105 domain-containing protein [Rhodospirillales bacterium]